MIMRTFAQKQNQPQLPVSSKALIPDSSNYHPQQIQQLIDNRVAHDFSRIPVHSTYPATALRTKLTANTRGDRHEQEADRVADQVMQTSRGGSSSLPSAFQRLQSGFGQDLSHVRLHADDSAAQQARAIGARAFTLGNDIYFSHGALQPESEAGMRLLAHEVAHTFQQAEGRAPAGIAQRTEDWNFTPDDYSALVKGQGKLTFASDSAWFPSVLQQNLMDTLVLYSRPRSPFAPPGSASTIFITATLWFLRTLRAWPRRPWILTTK